MPILNHNFQDSTMLSSCGYDTEAKELTVYFNTGRSYIYVDVPRSDYEDLINASSAGKFFNSIKAGLKQKYEHPLLQCCSIVFE